jgi:release factor glutamine methyltransferase
MSSSSKKVFFGNLVFLVDENVYEPAEDSFLFAENVKIREGSTAIDVGTGCGLLAVIAARRASLVVGVDINPYAIRCAAENAKLNHVENKSFFLQTDLFAAIKRGSKFDFIFFNAPYLPVACPSKVSRLERAWTGGKSGREMIDRFVLESPDYLKRGGSIFLMQSTLSNMDETLREFERQGLGARVVAKLDLPFFETIVLVEAKR